MNADAGPTPNEELTHETVKQKSPLLRLALIVVSLLAVGSLLVGIYALLIAYRAMEKAAIRGADLGQTVQDVCASASTAPEQKALGEACPKADQVVSEAPPEALPSPGPSGAPGKVGPSGSPGERGPRFTEAQMRAIVADWCRDSGECRAPGPTQAQINTALAAVCSESDDCKGDKGDTVVGPTGPPGATVTGPVGPSGPPGETVVGPSGPPGPQVSDEQIDARVALYCQAEPDNCVSEIICPPGSQPTQLEVRVRGDDLPPPEYQMIQTCA